MWNSQPKPTKIIRNRSVSVVFQFQLVSVDFRFQSTSQIHNHKKKKTTQHHNHRYTENSIDSVLKKKKPKIQKRERVIKKCHCEKLRMKRSSRRGEAGVWRWWQRPICVEAAAEVDQGDSKGRFMWRPTCEGDDRGRSRQRWRQIHVEAGVWRRCKGRFMWRPACQGDDRGRSRQRRRQIHVEAGVWRWRRGKFKWKPAWSGGCERDWSGGYESWKGLKWRFWTFVSIV